MGAGGSAMRLHVQLSSNIYYTGDTVQGDAFVHSNETVKLKNIYLEV